MSSVIPYISLLFSLLFQFISFHILFMYHALYFPTFIFTMYVPRFPFFLIDHNWKQVLLIKESSFSWSSEIFFCSFQLFQNNHIHNVVSTLINVVNLDAENNNIVSTLSNAVNINIEIDNVDSRLFDVVNFNVEIHNVVSTLIWHCLTLQHHITLSTTLRQRWNVCWVLKNVAKRLHSLVRSMKLRTYIFSRIPLNCCFCKLSKGYWQNNFGLTKLKKKIEKN